MNTLAIGSRFPDLRVHTADGTTLHLPDDLRGHIAILLFYRGRW